MYIKDKNGYDIFEIVITTDKKYKDISFSAEVYEITSYDVNTNKPIDDDKELYLKCSIKWDSCSHFWFGEEDGYLHICGRNYYDNHINLIKTLYNLAFKEMGREPIDEQEKLFSDIKILGG